MTLQGSGTTYNGSPFCPKCGKPYTYVGDVPEGGFPVGSEPYCCCGTRICGKCGQRVAIKPCDHEEEV